MSFLQGFLWLEGSGQKDDKFGNPARTGDFQEGSYLGANRAQADPPVLSDAGWRQTRKQGRGDLRFCLSALQQDLDFGDLDPTGEFPAGTR